MEARFVRGAVLVAACTALGASYRTPNFAVEAPTPEMAQKIGQAAERYRHDLAIEWVGKALPQWSRRCPIKARVAPNLGAGGATSFLFEQGEVYGWQMNIQGSFERILDSVLPHEVTHTIFASHFRRALPRWADEGAATSVEHVSERAKQDRLLLEVLTTGRGIPFSTMFTLKEYPRDILPLYAQGYSLARYLLAHGGKRRFLMFLSDGMRDEDWPRAVAKYYHTPNLLVLQNTWLDWVRRGSPPIESEGHQPAAGVLLAQADGPARSTPGVIYRAQSADPPGLAGERLVPIRQTTAVSGRRAVRTPAAGATPVAFPPDSPVAHFPDERPRAARPGAAAAGTSVAAGPPRQATPVRARPRPVVHIQPPRQPSPPRQVLIEWRRPRPSDELRLAVRPN